MRYVAFLVACLLWPFCGIIADINDVKSVGALSFVGMVLAGIYIGLDLLLAPKTSLPLLLNKELFPAFAWPAMIRLIGILFILMNLMIFVLQMRVWSGAVPLP